MCMCIYVFRKHTQDFDINQNLHKVSLWQRHTYAFSLLIKSTFPFDQPWMFKSKITSAAKVTKVLVKFDLFFCVALDFDTYYFLHSTLYSYSNSIMLCMIYHPLFKLKQGKDLVVRTEKRYFTKLSNSRNYVWWRFGLFIRITFGYFD